MIPFTRGRPPVTSKRMAIWLRIELGCEVLDLCFFHDVGPRSESLADLDIFEV
jgi:hypothetical protein